MIQNITSIQSITRKWDEARELWTLEVHYSATNPATKTSGDYALKLTEDPRAEMIIILANVAPLLCTALKLPVSYANSIHPWGEMKVWAAKWSLDSKGFEYATLKANKPIGLEKDIPVVLPPVMVGTLSDELCQALGLLKAECVHYILGDRLQCSIFDDCGVPWGDIMAKNLERITGKPVFCEFGGNGTPVIRIDWNREDESNEDGREGEPDEAAHHGGQGGGPVDGKVGDRGEEAVA